MCEHNGSRYRWSSRSARRSLPSDLAVHPHGWYGEDERFDAVATIRCSQGIAVDTRFGKIHTLEAITASLADRYPCGIQYGVIDYQLETVVHLLALIVGSIIAIDTGRVERSDGTVPFIDPHIR